MGVSTESSGRQSILRAGRIVLRFGRLCPDRCDRQIIFQQLPIPGHIAQLNNASDSSCMLVRRDKPIGNSGRRSRRRNPDPFMSDIATTLQHNLDQIHREIDAACIRSGRDSTDVRLVAVTKYADWSWVQALSGLHSVFGENRPQQLSERQPLLPNIEWHLIGQLQRNKVRLALSHAAVIHSVDSLRLLERIAQVAGEMKIRPRVLLQVNVSGEQSKSGFSPAELIAHWAKIVSFASSLVIDGFMTMAPEDDDSEAARPTFRALRILRDQLAGNPDSKSCGLTLTELSMGMSGDFPAAVEEGATLVRIGSRIYDGLAEPTSSS